MGVLLWSSGLVGGTLICICRALSICIVLYETDVSHFKKLSWSMMAVHHNGCIIIL